MVRLREAHPGISKPIWKPVEIIPASTPILMGGHTQCSSAYSRWPFAVHHLDSRSQHSGRLFSCKIKGKVRSAEVPMVKEKEGTASKLRRLHFLQSGCDACYIIDQILPYKINHINLIWSCGYIKSMMSRASPPLCLHTAVEQGVPHPQLVGLALKNDFKVWAMAEYNSFPSPGFPEPQQCTHIQLT